VYRSKSGPLVSALRQSRQINAPDASARDSPRENSTPRRAHVSRLTAVGLGRVQTRQNIAAGPPASTSSRSPEN